MPTQTANMRMTGTQGVSMTVSMYISDCPHCGVIFAITSDFEARRREDKEFFYCPNGHTMSWTESTADRLAREKTKLEKRLAHEQEWSSQQAAWLRNERAEKKAVQRSLSATKGVLTKTKKRVAAGVCPCCKRTFQQLSRHMAGKHPEYPSKEE